jgi:rare lipoprotein A
MLLAGCGHHKKTTRLPVPPPPETAASTPPEPSPDHGAAVTPKGKPLYQEVGIASWYGPYMNRRTANGEFYDGHALTAAHRTLPLNSVARITNLKTGRTAVVRITDRGPFVEGRMLDLSIEAAKQLDVWREGTARVKLEVVQAPAPIEYGGRWCVQIGAFSSKNEAARFKRRLESRYREARVLQFTGSTGEWLRVRIPGDQKARLQAVLRETSAPEGASFLVRLD